MFTETNTNIKAFTKDEVHAMLAKLVNPREKFLLLATFEGIFSNINCLQAIFSTKYIDTEKKTFTVSWSTSPDGHITFPVSQELIDIAFESARTFTYQRVDGNIVDIGTNQNKDDILKLSLYDESGKQRSRHIYNLLTFIAAKLDLEMPNFRNVITASGEISYISERATAYNMRVEEYVNSEHAKEVNDKYCTTSCKEFYEEYKECFNKS